MSDISSTLNYLYSLHSRGIKPGLERLELFLDKIGNPHKSFKSFHIAGTNGKGTVANIVYAVLLANGYSVGLYTSPHLLKFNERIVIKGVEIDDLEIASFVTRHRDLIDELQLTFFEITTAMAFDAFRKASVDYAVIEVGLGGRLDATNLVSPLTSVICDISMDHEEWLGKSIKQIAAENRLYQ